MPLHAVISATPAPEPPPQPTPPPPPRRFEQPYISWTPNGGQEMVLISGSDVVALAGIQGLGMVPEEQHETQLAGDGFMRNHRRAAGGEVMIPVKIARQSGETLTTFTAKRRALYAAFDPRRGPGALLWAMPDGTRRHWTCMYSSGLNSPLQGEQGAVLWAHYQIILRSEDPYWHGDERTITFSLSNGAEFYPIPFTISPSTTSGDSTVVIDGEVEVYPVWTLRGPMDTATLRNRDTGQTLELTPDLSAGERLTVRTDPRVAPNRKFTRETGLNWWHRAAGQFPVMWALQPGANDVTVLGTGTTSESRIELAYAPRYLSA